MLKYWISGLKTWDSSNKLKIQYFPENMGFRASFRSKMITISAKRGEKYENEKKHSSRHEAY